MTDAVNEKELQKERKEIMDLCDVKESELKIYQRKKYNKSFGITIEDEVRR